MGLLVYNGIIVGLLDTKFLGKVVSGFSVWDTRRKRNIEVRGRFG